MKQTKRKTSSSSNNSGMMLPKSLTTVTPLSRMVALVAFLIIPFITFFLGVKMQNELDRVDFDRGATYYCPPAMLQGVKMMVPAVKAPAPKR